MAAKRSHRAMSLIYGDDGCETYGFRAPRGEYIYTWGFVCYYRISIMYLCAAAVYDGETQSRGCFGGKKTERQSYD